MESILFEVITKAGFLAALVIGFIVWDKAGRPFVTISRR